MTGAKAGMALLLRECSALILSVVAGGADVEGFSTGGEGRSPMAMHTSAETHWTSADSEGVL